MIKGAVIGNPILFSQSPVVYKNLFKISGRNGYYTRLASDNIEHAYKLSKALNLNFINVTSPFKSQFSKLPDLKHSEEVLTFESANSAIFGNINKTFNTDVFALMKIIESLNLSNDAKVLIIGFGDTGLMCLKALNSIFNRIDVLSRRDLSYEQMLLKNFRSQDKILHNKYDLIINTHILCNFGFAEDFFRDSVVIDTIYNKPWLNKFESKKYISGLRWLELQAHKTFTNLTDLDIHDIRDINYEWNKLDLIFLIGFMGAGKTTIGRELAKGIGYGFVDIDELIHLKTGFTIRQIFETGGEQAFRDLEAKSLKECKQLSNYIVATGGGIINRKENLEVLKSGSVIWLYESYDKLIKRIIETDRPLLNNSTEQLFNERNDKYFFASDLIIQNNNYNNTLKLLIYEISSAI